MKKNDWRKRLRRLEFNFRRHPITLVGDEGRPYRKALLILCGLLLVLLLALFSREEPQLMASPEVDSIQDRAVLRVGIRYDIPDLSGLEQALAQAMAQKILPEADAATRLSLVEVNPMTAFPKLDDGSVDVVIAMVSSTMASQYYYSIPYYSDPCLLVTLEEGPAFQLLNMELGVVQSNNIRKSPELLLLEAYTATHAELGLKAKTYASYPDMLDALVRGEIRAALLPETYVELYGSLYPIAPSTFSFGTIDYAICAPSDASSLASIGTLVLNTLMADGQLSALYRANGLDPARIPVQTP